MTTDPADTRADALFASLRPISLQALNAKAAMLERLDNKYVGRGEVLRTREVNTELVQIFTTLGHSFYNVLLKTIRQFSPPLMDSMVCRRKSCCC